MQSEQVVIAFSAPELQQLERIVMDRDKSMALEFVQKVIKPRLDAINKRQLHRPLDR